jgi:hypothetical protein
MATLRVEGHSGGFYEYALVETDKVPPLYGGNFLFIRPSTVAPEIIYVGESESVYGALTETNVWNVARQIHGATLLYVHLNPDPARRKAEREDLIRRYHPAMNETASESGRPEKGDR